MSWNRDAKGETAADTDQTVEIKAVAVDSQTIDDSAQTTTDPETAEQVTTEEFRIKGDELVAKVKTLIHEGNIRRIIVKNESGQPLIEIPLTVGVVGGVLSAALFPVLAAVGAIGAVVAHLTLVIEKRE
jgi:Domain of unknown function (DUF4342)